LVSYYYHYYYGMLFPYYYLLLQSHFPKPVHFSAVIFHYRLRNFVTWIKLVKALLIFNVATVRVL
jgi:hypothetical protein